MADWVYILQSESTTRYYIGSTGNLEDRLHRHNANRSAATRGRGPWRLMYAEELPRRQAAVDRERQIKGHKSRAYVDALCASRTIG
jgi:putative endonuclease